MRYVVGWTIERERERVKGGMLKDGGSQTLTLVKQMAKSVVLMITILGMWRSKAVPASTHQVDAIIHHDCT